METQTSIRNRCSLKTHVSGRQIDPEIIDTILEAAILAPSARNTQPWRFVVVQGQEAVENLVDHAFGENTQMVRDANAVIVVCAKPEDDVIVDGKEYYLFDCGSAVENMLLAATDLGLVTHLILRFNEAAVKEILNIPDDVRVVITTPMAYPLEGNYDEAAKDRLSQRTRKTFDEVVYYQQWAEPVPA
ncbi:MAG TPA: nitroreductase family protein [Anaerolineales bacterium]|nr:nitroreductase family protein [Anaerolineales bacterium]